VNETAMRDAEEALRQVPMFAAVGAAAARNALASGKERGGT